MRLKVCLGFEQTQRCQLPDIETLPDNRGIYWSVAKNRHECLTRAFREDALYAVSGTEFCPLVVKRFQQVQQNLETDASLAGVRLLSVTLDPAFDTPQVLSAYASAKGANPARWQFVTGPPNRRSHGSRPRFRSTSSGTASSSTIRWRRQSSTRTAASPRSGAATAGRLPRCLMSCGASRHRPRPTEPSRADLGQALPQAVQDARRGSGVPEHE